MGERPGGEGEGHADPQLALRMTDQTADRVLRLADVVKDAPGVPLEQQPGICQPQMPGRALDQDRTDRLLEPDERPARR